MYLEPIPPFLNTTPSIFKKGKKKSLLLQKEQQELNKVTYYEKT